MRVFCLILVSNSQIFHKIFVEIKNVLDACVVDVLINYISFAGNSFPRSLLHSLGLPLQDFRISIIIRNIKHFQKES